MHQYPDSFLNKLFHKHQLSHAYPTTSSVCKFVQEVLSLLFPEQTKTHFHTKDELSLVLSALQDDLAQMLSTMQMHLPASASKISYDFFQALPDIDALLQTDIQAILQGDPAAKSEYEVIRAYPGFYAIAFYRMAHVLHNLGVPIIPRIITEFAHSKTGIDIHPGADIDAYFFIDHGTGIVIGETTIIGKNVKLYQGVTLGALSVSKDMASQKRHPTIEHDVVIYSGATILGGETVIGHNSIVGGNVWLTRSIEPYTKIYHQEQVKIV